MKKFVRILEKDINEIIQRLGELDLNPAETLVLMTEHTYKGFMGIASGVNQLHKDPITHLPHKIPVTEYSLFTIYKMQIVPVVLLDQTEWWAIQLFSSQATTKVFSAKKTENLVLIELNDSISEVIIVDYQQ